MALESAIFLTYFQTVCWKSINFSRRKHTRGNPQLESQTEPHCPWVMWAGCLLGLKLVKVMKIRIVLNATMFLFGVVAFFGSVKAQGAAVPTSKNIAIIEVSVTGIEAEGALTTLALMVDTDRLVSASGEELAKIPGNSLELMQERLLSMKECQGGVN